MNRKLTSTAIGSVMQTTTAERKCVRISRIAIDAMMISSRSVPVTVWMADSIRRVRS